LPDGQDGTTPRVRANMALPGPWPYRVCRPRPGSRWLPRCRAN
jgi:hypothetical protein